MQTKLTIGKQEWFFSYVPSKKELTAALALAKARKWAENKRKSDTIVGGKQFWSQQIARINGYISQLTAKPLPATADVKAFVKMVEGTMPSRAA